MSQPDPINALHNRVENDHGYHPPSTPDVVAAHEEVRRLLANAAHNLIELVPLGRELSTALTKLDEARMWANMGIACNTSTTEGSTPNA